MILWEQRERQRKLCSGTRSLILLPYELHRNLLLKQHDFFVWLVGFLTSSPASRLYRGRVPRLTSDNFMCCHTRDRAGRPCLMTQPVTLYLHRPNLVESDPDDDTKTNFVTSISSQNDKSRMALHAVNILSHNYFHAIVYLHIIYPRGFMHRA